MTNPEAPETPEPADEPESTSPRETAHPRETARPRGEDTEPDLRGSFERILPELLRRGLSVGRERVGEGSLPRELTNSLISHMGDIRAGIVKAVGQEVGRFLREADIASEIRKVMAGIDVEASVRLRFNERKDGALQTELEVERPKRASDRPKRE